MGLKICRILRARRVYDMFSVFVGSWGFTRAVEGAEGFRMPLELMKKSCSVFMGVS